MGRTDEWKLPPRLAAIAGLVPQGSVLADVGTDHAFLPVWLLKEGRIAAAIATDIHEGPLRKARETAERWAQDSIRFCLCDGLDAVAPHAADVIVIAGLGGDNMTDILRRAPWTREDTLLILQPMSRQETLRRALPAMGYAATGERLVRDAGRIYPILTVRGGVSTDCSPAEYYIGRWEQVCGEPLLAEYIGELLRRLNGAREGLLRSEREEDRRRLAETETVITELRACLAQLQGESI